MMPAFDTRAAVARILGARDDARPISRISAISTGAPPETESAKLPDAGMDDARHNAPERAAMAAHYAEPATTAPYLPGDPDSLRDGLLAGAWLLQPAARLRWQVEAGHEWRWCAAGGLDVFDADGAYWGIAPGLAEQMREAGLLPVVVMEARP
jgi:hypothetical protein